MNRYLFLDLETYSEVSIKHGAQRYAESAEILLFAWAVGSEPASVWDLTSGKPMPEGLRAALREAEAGGRYVVSHNGMMFDAVVIERVLGIRIPPEMVLDTMVMAYECGLPGALGDLCDVLRLPQDVAKDKDGKRLVHLFCSPMARNCKLHRATAQTHPEDWARFVNYCRLDVESEREIFRRLPRFNLTEAERAIQAEDARINRRGMLMDLDLARAAIAASEENKASLDAETARLTGGEVAAATQRTRLLEYFKAHYGIELADLSKAEVAKRMEDPELPEPMKELLRLRLFTAKTSVQKYRAVLEGVNSDGRLRGCLQFRGAARTGRWSGRLFQPQNLPRPAIKDPAEIEMAIEACKGGSLPLIYEDIGAVLASLLRGLIIAPPGRKLVVADYSNVEGRVLAWLAGETWKLRAFRDFDAGTGFDLYKLTYARTFGIRPEDVTKSQRQMGKVLELALGYGGGAGAFCTFARGFGIDLDQLAETAERSVPYESWSEASDSYHFFQEKGLTHGLARKTFVACDAIKRAWRKANPRISSLWGEAEEAVAAVLNGAPSARFGRIEVDRWRAYLRLRLPSGRYLSYPSPRLEEDGSCAFTYAGAEQFSRKWKRIKTYGGKLVENVTQAAACDLLAHGLLQMEKAGYETVLTIHDEAIAETPDTPEYSLDGMKRLMASPPPWAAGLPLVAAGFEGYRYRKD